VLRKVLVANRGEIAVRVLRACRELGIATVAVYSEADAGALHVRLADEAWPCGPADARKSYLDAEGLVAVARHAGADAVHPGYGFLSENGDFADACEAAGLVFVGPSGDVIRRMGDKVTSRRVMREAGVSVVPGTEGRLADEEAPARARELGFPVMVKASAGGGGRGLRLVRDEGELAKALPRARSEALSAFGDDGLYLEKAIAQPRHVEVQVLADADGRTVHLFERACSVQRRHQKILEEAPAPDLDAELRTRLGAAAVEAARAVGYRGAGTVEFLLDPDGAFYFLEMNTRIQVEHPVTEAVTGVDLVKTQLALAGGAPLPFDQEDLALRGHAIEARVYAEDPARGFLPSPGRLGVFRPPSGPGVRVDVGVEAGAAVTPHYDALLAKVIAFGADREEATARLQRAVDEFAVSGVATTLPFHRSLVRSELFRAGRYDTGVVAALQAEGAPAPAEAEGWAALAPHVAAAALLGGPGELGLDPGDGARRAVVRDAGDGALDVALDDAPPRRLAVVGVGPGLFAVRDDDGGVHEAVVDRQGARAAVVVGGFSARYKVLEPSEGDA
jgi:acetyl-CoA carboxylase biotin carboxylase subunit